MVCEQMLHSLDLERQGGTGSKPEQDHAGVRLVARNDEFAEIAVVGNQDPLFSTGDVEDLWVREAGRIVNSNRGNVISPLS